MEEANHLAKYESEVYVIHRRNTFRALKITQNIVRENPKIRVVSMGFEGFRHDPATEFLAGS